MRRMFVVVLLSAAAIAHGRLICWQFCPQPYHPQCKSSVVALIIFVAVFPKVKTCIPRAKILDAFCFFLRKAKKFPIWANILCALVLNTYETVAYFFQARESSRGKSALWVRNFARRWFRLKTLVVLFSTFLRKIPSHLRQNCVFVSMRHFSEGAPNTMKIRACCAGKTAKGWSLYAGTTSDKRVARPATATNKSCAYLKSHPHISSQNMLQGETIGGVPL